jgi:hypothetical protein
MYAAMTSNVVTVCVGAVRMPTTLSIAYSGASGQDVLSGFLHSTIYNAVGHAVVDNAVSGQTVTVLRDVEVMGYAATDKFGEYSVVDTTHANEGFYYYLAQYGGDVDYYSSVSYTIYVTYLR